MHYLTSYIIVMVGIVSLGGLDYIPTIFKGVGFFNAFRRNPVAASTFPKALKKPTPFGRFLCKMAFVVGKPLATLVGSCVISTRDKRC
jgi:hypothetical protein